MGKWKTTKAFRIIFSILICQLAGLIGSVFTFSSIPTWYEALNKPSFSPPNWIFGPVWIVLYTLMGISLFLVWEKGLKKRLVEKGIIAFGVQLALNAMWTYIFFGLKLPEYAFFEILFLWISIAITIARFYVISKKAAYLLLPYLIWVSFAMVLNYYVWILNL